MVAKTVNGTLSFAGTLTYFTGKEAEYGTLSFAGAVARTKRRMIISDPQAILDWSDDGGRTWSNEHWVSIGKIGEYQQRAKWRRLGSSRNRTFRLTITDPVPVEIMAANATVRKGKA